MHANWLSHQITRPVEIGGIGVHSGEHCVVTVKPGIPGGGCWMERAGERWPVTIDSVVDVERCTVLGNARQRVATVEHLLAALASFNLYDCEIEVQGGEIPILDGSALPFVEALRPNLVAGGPVCPYVLEQPVWVGNESSQVLALPSDTSRLHYSLYYPHPQLGYQEVTFAPQQQSFADELAPARTFALEQEVEWLRAKGLARGGSLDNALVVRSEGFSSPLRLPMEPVRHKCLDLLGDLYLLGRPLQAQVLAVKAGHRWHTDLVRKMQQEVVGHVG
ncbi:UDP-3-O-[3-hydroxymyristoyl] N-acetylglucosamine deacetylase [bacterium]|nr:UDP-3-O-[3-hydroxymyristoyl] N-acetylglucosamine deacetylase [bacterium]